MPTGVYLKSAVLPDDFPEGDKPEIVLTGRSNAGKSSFLNSLCNNHKLAKISRTPGKTRTINFFDVGQKYRIVDLPGYGFAKRPVEERELWDQMISQYFTTREAVIGVLLICDVRREWSSQEEAICELAQDRGAKILCILTKADKLGRTELARALASRIKEARRPKEFFRVVSSLKNQGIEDLEKEIYTSWVCKPSIADL